MESSELRRRRIKQNRRKERAEKVEKERATNDPDDDNVGPPVKKPRRKPRKPVAEEDIVDGFAILAFKNYDDLTRAVKLAEEDSDHKKICVQLLKRSQEGGGDNNKTIEKDKKLKKPKTNSALSTLPFKENGEIMVDKVPGIDIRSSVPSSVSPYPHPKKLGRMNGPSSKDSSLHTLICESDDNGDKISDGCSDLFAPSRKDSSPTQPDNLHSSNESKGVDVQRHQSNCEKKPSSPSSTVVNVNSSVEVKLQTQQIKHDPLELNSIKPLHKNGSVSSGIGTEELNGIRPHVDQSSGIVPLPSIENKVAFQHQKPFKATAPQTLFTPYAATAITRVNTPIIPVSSQSSVQENLRDHSESPQPKPIQNSQSQRVNRNHISVTSGINPSSNSLNSGSFLSSTGSHIRHNSSPVLDQTLQSKPAGSPSPLSGQVFNRKSFSPSSKVIPATTKSIAFGSIARLLDSPTTSSSPISSSNATVTASTNYSSVNHQSVTGHLANGSNHNGIGASTPITCSSRSHSPRGHSPSRERDSYSSNVSSLSRTSVTPVSGSNQAPPTLSPLQNLQSYSKAASWLNTVPGLSPVPRPTPPPASNSSSGSVASNSLISGGGVGGSSLQISGGASLAISGGGSLSITAGTAPSPHSVFPGLVPGAPHTLPPSHSAAAMFAPPILPLTSIAPHPSAHPSPFGPATDALFHGSYPWSATSSELVRRDLESRFLSSERSLGGGPSNFMTRPGDLHSHSHPLLPPLSGVNHLPPQSPGAPNPPQQHSALFPSPLFKDMPKVGLDSSFYRTNLALQYPGFNGMLPPNLAATPFAPPSQIAAFTPKITDACKPAKVMKAGRWNAMHVRIAWEIYQDQQKGGGGENKGGNSSSSPVKSSLLVSSANSNPIVPPPPTSSGLAADLLRQPPQHVFAGLSRPPDVGPGPPYSASLLSPHHGGPPPTHRPQFDSPHSLFLNSAAHLGPPLPRYPGFAGLGPTYGGLGGLGSSLLGRDLSSLAALGPSQEHWHRSHRGPPFPQVGQLSSGWPMQRPDRDVKTPIESRRHKEERVDKRQEYHSESGKGNRDMSPFRDRSPLRPSRTPLENGDTDSRSSRSSDSHSTVHISSNKSFSRNKEESNGDMDRTATPLMALEREKLLHQLPSDSKHQALISVSHPSRLYHPGSPLSTPTSMGGWESFPGLMGSGPRMPGADSFRLSFLPLSERERELSRMQNSAMRPPMFSNGPFANIPPLGMGQPVMHSNSGSSAITKGSPGGGPIPLLNPSISAAVHNHLLHSSSLNGPHSPKLEDFNPASMRTKEDSQSR
ncbi:unnamed protein product [Allacma fusca]|uniref:Fibrosin n=1 Tax=Allacma fusca TaxID=39272 RepID=A0A8J2JSM9_9HEXA|nr:unnamed protein product [Allacma fusca]